METFTQPVISCFSPFLFFLLDKGFWAVWAQSDLSPQWAIECSKCDGPGLSQWENSLIGNGPFTDNGDTAQSTWLPQRKDAVICQDFLIYSLVHLQRKTSFLIKLPPTRLSTLYFLYTSRLWENPENPSFEYQTFSVCKISFSSANFFFLKSETLQRWSTLYSQQLTMDSNNDTEYRYFCFKCLINMETLICRL